MLQDFLLALIVCGDMLLTAAAYGMTGIRISLRAALILSIMGAAALTAAMLAARLIGLFIPLIWCRYAGCLILSALGGISIFRSLSEKRCTHLKERNPKNKPHFLDICLDAAAADADGSKSLSWTEAALLALALSLDSLAAGFGAGLQNPHPIRCGLFCLFIGFFCVTCGYHIGRHLHRKSSMHLDWLTGLLLILLALLQLRA